ncbi:MAG: hypothetical protein M5U23_01720 [Acidimicrobiia bacterium]|nr:hypothetical protein [Acidimicrobiia bacterium]
MNKIGIGVVVLLVVAACSSTSAETTTTADGGAATTTTAAGVTTTSSATPETTTTTAAPATGGLADCVIGSWELDAANFMDQISESLADSEEPSELVYLGGVYRITADADGTFTDERIDFSFGVETDFGNMELTINHKQVGTYTIDGDTMSTVIPGGQGAPDVQISIDGVPFDPPGGIMPIEAPEASFEAVTPDCGDNTMSVTSEGVTTIWNRVS